jgi:sugar phosphate isomerase/epimerase
MEFGLIHYNAPGETFETFLDFVAAAGYHYVEVQIGDIWPESEANPEDKAKVARQQLEGRGLEASALSVGNNFAVLEESEISAQVARVKRICGLAQLLGTKVLRTEGGWGEAVPEARWAEAIAGCLARCREFIEPMGILLAVDNHGYMTNRAELQLEILERVNSPNVGLNLDTMNYRWFGHDLETIDRYYEMVAPHVFHTHFKDGRGAQENYVGTALGEGEIHLDYAITCLKRAGYKGVWCVEYEGRTDPAEGYKKSLAWMRRHITG